METLIIYFQLKCEPDDSCHKIIYGHNGVVTEKQIEESVLRHANGSEIRRVWW